MSTAYSIGNSQRQNFSKLNSTNVPGPGTYNAEKKPSISQPQWGIGTGQKFQWKTTTSPGPGKYEPKYTADSKITTSPSYGISHRYSDFPETNKFTPSSDTYNPNTSSVYESPPKYSMGSKTYFQSTQLFNMRSKSPGTGQYETNISTMKNVPCTIIGNSKRQGFVPRDNTPGVGKYSNTEYRSQSPQHKFGSESRDKAFTIQASTTNFPALGPGAYDGVQGKKDKGYQMGTRLIDPQQKEIQKVPGPGTYETIPKINKNNNPKAVIGSEQRKLFNQIRYMNKLGPGEYSASIDYTREKSPQTIIGNSKRADYRINPQNPSPGSYEAKSTVKNLPSTIWGQYTEERSNKDFCDKKTSKSPSPQQYNVKTLIVEKKDMQTVIGLSQRPNYARSISPGAGRYNVQPQSTDNPKYSFGSQIRELKFKRYEESPGPGQYEIKHTIGEVNKYVITDPSKNKIKI